MKKIFTLMMLVFFTVGIAACGNGANPSGGQEMGGSKAAEAQQPSGGNKKILVAYFSYSGNTEKVARQIHEHMGGDLFRIETVTPYPQNYHECTEVVKKEIESNTKPQLKGGVANIRDYDIVFIGYPIWWYTAPMPIQSFLEAHDLAGKTVIPFCTSGGSPLSDSLPVIQKLCPASEIKPGIRAYPDDAAATEKWLDALQLNK